MAYQGELFASEGREILLFAGIKEIQGKCFENDQVDLCVEDSGENLYLQISARNKEFNDFTCVVNKNYQRISYDFIVEKGCIYFTYSDIRLHPQMILTQQELDSEGEKGSIRLDSLPNKDIEKLKKSQGV